MLHHNCNHKIGKLNFSNAYFNTIRHNIGSTGNRKLDKVHLQNWKLGGGVVGQNLPSPGTTTGMDSCSLAWSRIIIAKFAMVRVLTSLTWQWGKGFSFHEFLIFYWKKYYLKNYLAEIILRSQTHIWNHEGVKIKITPWGRSLKKTLIYRWVPVPDPMRPICKIGFILELGVFCSNLVL